MKHAPGEDQIEVPGKESAMEMESKSKLRSILAAALLTIGLVVVLLGGMMSGGSALPSQDSRMQTGTAVPTPVSESYIQHQAPLCLVSKVYSYCSPGSGSASSSNRRPSPVLTA